MGDYSKRVPTLGDWLLEPRTASAEGTRADVRSRLAGACRHCVVAGCRLSMDFNDLHQVVLMAYAGMWVDLSLWLHAEIAPFVGDTSAQF